MKGSFKVVLKAFKRRVQKNPLYVVFWLFFFPFP